MKRGPGSGFYTAGEKAKAKAKAGKKRKGRNEQGWTILRLTFFFSCCDWWTFRTGEVVGRDGRNAIGSIEYPHCRSTGGKIRYPKMGVQEWMS